MRQTYASICRESIEHDKFLRLRAEMKVPAPRRCSVRFQQRTRGRGSFRPTAIFVPRDFAGMLHAGVDPYNFYPSELGG
jgi:hypothetical protein